MRALEDELPGEHFNMWVRPLQAVESSGALKLLAPNRFAVDWVNAHLLSRLGEIVRRFVEGDAPIVTVEVGSRGPESGAARAASDGNGVDATQAQRRHRRRRPAESGFHVQWFRRRQEQPARQGRGGAGRRESGPRLQPAVHLRRRRSRQDAPDAGRGSRHQGARSRSARRVHPLRAIRERHGHRASAQQDERVQDGVSLARCAADRRHPVLREQGSLAGRILPHVQRAARRAAAGHRHLRIAIRKKCRVSKNA